MNSEAAAELANFVRWVNSRGWAPGTGGNFSSVISEEPFELLITQSGLDKGEVSSKSFLIVDEKGHRLRGEGTPSAETLLHIAIIQQLGAKLVAHTHSVWNTLASLVPGDGIMLSDVEMLKGLAGISSHQHHEFVPTLDNSQDIAELARRLGEVLKANRSAHAVLLRGHGLYTWGHNMFELRRHVEVLEFLFELFMRARQMKLKWHI